MKKSIYTGTLFSLIFFISNTEANAMKFCPSELESEAREVLNIKDYEEIKIQELTKILDRKGLVYEDSKIDNIPVNCVIEKQLGDYSAIMVYGGLDPEKKYKRTFLVIYDTTGSVILIDKRHMYRAPKLF